MQGTIYQSEKLNVIQQSAYSADFFVVIQQKRDIEGAKYIVLFMFSNIYFGTSMKNKLTYITLRFKMLRTTTMLNICHGLIKINQGSIHVRPSLHGTT